MQRLLSVSIVTIVLSLFAASPASAQEYKLTGLYFGGHVGTGIKTPDFIVHEDGPSAYNDFLFTDRMGQVSGGVIFGGQAGYNRAIGQKLVVGGEIAFGKTGFSGSVLNGPGNDTEHKTRGGLYWTGLGKVGYRLNDRAMPYFTLGILGATNKVRTLDDCVVSPCGPLTKDASLSIMVDEFVWGFGFEYALGMRAMNKSWTAKAEYLISDFRFDGVAVDGNHSFHYNTHFPQGLIRGSINVYWGDK